MSIWFIIVGAFILCAAVVFGVWQAVRKHELDLYCRFLEYENSCFRAELAAIDPNNKKLGSDNRDK